MMFRKVLIANRGEIACRIIKTARRMGIETIAIYSTADQDALHVKLADSAFCIGPPEASKSYLNVDAIIHVALANQAEAIHPGYGFLSENPQMALACQNANLTFIGPSVDAILVMGSKQLAKKRLENTQVPITPGYHGADQSDEDLHREAERLGFPVLIKAANGGGGKGMRTVHKSADFLKDLAGARREAQRSFADDTIIIEKLISNPRHVEIQIMADNHHNIVHLFERDCSIQRRHQKIIEEAPAFHLPETLRQELAKAAIEVARTIDYRGAGTVEFLVDTQFDFYFMEMNTRLQVEHPVTEMITGLDLVEWQFKIAANEPLPLQQKDIKGKGHAIECRVYAEDPHHDFIPSIGQIQFLKEPTGEGIRIDSGVGLKSHITMHYDPMIAKLITWGDSREEALQRLRGALKHYHIRGVKTNLPFLQAIVNHPSFIKAAISTNFLSQYPLSYPEPDLRLTLLFAASFDYLCLLQDNDSLYQDTFAWQMHLKSHWPMHYIIHEKSFLVVVHPINHCELTLDLLDETVTLKVTGTMHKLDIDDGKQSWHALVENLSDKLVFYTEEGSLVVDRFDWQKVSTEQSFLNKQLTAPMTSTIVAILKNKGEKIKMGERLIVLEAMKMEHTIHAPKDGFVDDIFYEVGAQVAEGVELVSIKDP